MLEIPIVILIAVCAFFGGAAVGALLGAYQRDCYWIDAAEMGVRAHARHQLYEVKLVGSDTPKGVRHAARQG